MKISLLLFLALSLFFGFQYPEYQLDNTQSIQHRIDSFYSNFPQQIVHLHLDKNVYHVKDPIFFAAYLVQYPDFKKDTSTTHLYIDWIDAYQQIVFSRLMALKSGVGSACVQLPDTMKAGNYKMRAYTQWMRNFSDKYFFESDIKIINPNPEHFSQTDFYRWKQQNKIKQKWSDDEEVVFLNENKNWITNEKSSLPFIFRYKSGEWIDIDKFQILNGNDILIDNGKMVYGFGLISLQPVENQKYIIRFFLKNGKSKDFKLPKPETDVNTLLIVKNENNEYSVRAKFNKNQNSQNNFIFCIQNGKIIFSKSAENEIKFSIDTLTTGIYSWILFDNNEILLAEKTFYHQKTETPIFKLRKSGTNYVLMVENKNLEWSDYSLSICVSTDSKHSNIKYSAYILPNFGSQSWCTPSFFQSDSTEWIQQILTCIPTERYKKIFDNTTPQINFTNQKNICVTGYTLADYFAVPISNCKLKLTILNQYNDVFETTSDNKGYFGFYNMQYFDSVPMKLEAQKEGGSKSIVMYLNDNLTPPEYGFSFFNDIPHEIVQTKGMQYPKKYKKEETDDTRSRIYGMADNTLKVSEQDGMTHSTIADLMRGRIPGVEFSGNTVRIRGINSINSGTEPLVLLDGMPTYTDVLFSMSPNDVEMIEVIKGGNAAIFGIRGSNGVIAIYTKQGKRMKRGEWLMTLPGFAKNTPFTPNHSQQTLHWNPNLILNEKGEYEFSLPQHSQKLYVTIEGFCNQQPISSHIEIEE